DETERVAETRDDDANPAVSALGLFHTRSRTEEVSTGRVAYVLAKDSCYAVDTVTGELVWRRVIGLEAPFFPLLANASQPSLLLYDSRRQTLVCCQPATGKLIWRQKLDGRPRSAPLVHEGQIYLATEDRALCRIDLDSGRLTAKVTFSQNVLGPPALSHDGKSLLIPGDMAMVYALTMRPLGAAAMTFTDHAAGAIVAPPVSMGKLLLLCENDKADSTRLRVFDAGQPTEPLAELTGARVAGAVRDAPVLRGNQLVVPSSNEHLAAFSVTDEAGRAGLAPVAQYRVKEGYGGPMFVALGPDRQFWSASSAFRRFEIGADNIRMDQNAQAQGIASQPLQLVGEQFFVGRKAPFHDAAVFSAVDRERMVSPWRIVLGAEPLELTAARDGGAVGVNEAGQIVSLGPARLKQGGIELKAATELQLPPEIRQPLRATRLHDGRLALAATGETTQVWIVSVSGQADATLKLSKGDVVEANPVLFDEGLVVPLASRLKLLPLGTGKKSVQDWLAPVGENARHRWRFLTRLDGNELIACDDSGLLTRVQLRTTDVPHLAGATKLQLDQPVDVAPALRGEMLFVADALGAVRQLNVRSFDVDGQRSFAAPVRGVWSVGESLLVWAGDDKLHAVSTGKELPERWMMSVESHQPAGSPVEWSGSIWVACRDGLVLALDPVSGKESRRIELPQVLSLGLRVIGDGLFAIACDGAVYRIDAGGQP
ncbi:MAG: PQQ-binding-like beta-propeller repeat protein, partial [Candidatus Saccharimonas sp.]|nr:PQQ-binding-like beta-propeller repeat protein [Planctomycetaceae bacterium]